MSERISLKRAWQTWEPEPPERDSIKIERLQGNLAKATLHADRLEMDLPVYLVFELTSAGAYCSVMRSAWVPHMTLPLSRSVACAADAQINEIRRKARETLL
jgi:hypothetical protein